MRSVERIVQALKLAPMTVRQLARCLMLGETAVRAALDELWSRLRVVRYRTLHRTRRMGAAPYVYELRA